MNIEELDFIDCILELYKVLLRNKIPIDIRRYIRDFLLDTWGMSTNSVRAILCSECVLSRNKRQQEWLDAKILSLISVRVARKILGKQYFVIRRLLSTSGYSLDSDSATFEWGEVGFSLRQYGWEFSISIDPEEPDVCLNVTHSGHVAYDVEYSFKYNVAHLDPWKTDVEVKDISTLKGDVQDAITLARKVGDILYKK